MEPIIFKNDVDYKNFIKASFVMYYRNLRIKLLYLLFLFMFTSALFAPESKNPILSASLILLFAIGFTALLYRRVRSIYKASPNRIDGSIWKMTEDGLEITGNNSFQHWGWEHINKIDITKHWVFIWFNKFQCIFFLKKSVSDDQLVMIYHLISKNKINI